MKRNFFTKPMLSAVIFVFLVGSLGLIVWGANKYQKVDGSVDFAALKTVKNNNQLTAEMWDSLMDGLIALEKKIGTPIVSPVDPGGSEESPIPSKCFKYTADGVLQGYSMGTQTNPCPNIVRIPTTIGGIKIKKMEGFYLTKSSNGQSYSSLSLIIPSGIELTRKHPLGYLIDTRLCEIGWGYAKDILGSVEFLEGVTEIPADYLRDCRNLSEVKFPNSMIKIGSYAFSDSGLAKGPYGTSHLGSPL